MKAPDQSLINRMAAVGMESINVVIAARKRIRKKLFLLQAQQKTRVRCGPGWPQVAQTL
jgi:hypothetical protein